MKDIYDPLTGEFDRKVYFAGGGYPYVLLDKRRIAAHRYAWETIHGNLEGGERIGFKDGDKSNLKIDNLYKVERLKPTPGPELLEWIRQRYRYENGRFYHLRGLKNRGKEMYSYIDEGYAYVTFRHRKMKRAHAVWLWHTGQWFSQSIDHINGNKQDDRIENLQDISFKENSQRRLGAAEFKKYPDGLYRPTVTHEGRLIKLGVYPTLEQAQSAYTGAKAVIREAIDDPCRGLA